MKNRFARRARVAGGLAVRNAVGAAASRLSRRAIRATDFAQPFEQLEPRQLMSTTPVLTIAGPATTNEGSEYTLNLSSSNLGSLSIDQWSINWGDGSSTVPGNATTADHVYEDGPNNYSITASATLSDGSTVLANLGSTTVGTGIDPTFGPGGTAVGTFGTQNSRSNAVALLDNGQFIVAGTIGTTPVALVRYNADGTVDTSFGTNGIVAVPTMNSLAGIAVEHVTDPVTGATDERLVVAGSFIGNPNLGQDSWYEMVDRFDVGATDTGSLDTTFGGTGSVTLPGNLNPANYPYSGDTALSMGIDNSGNIVVAGTTDGREIGSGDGEWLNVARLTSSGALDTTFGTNGQTHVDIGAGTSTYIFDYTATGNVLFGNDGSFIVPVAGGSNNMQLVKFGNDGSLQDYGSDGVGDFTISVPGSSISFNDAILDNNGNILLGGTYNVGNESFFALARLNYNTEALDTTFGAGVNQTIADPGFNAQGQLYNYAVTPGVVVTYLNYEENAINALAVTPGGQIVAAGVTTEYNLDGTQDFGIAQYNADGSLDSSFGDNSSGVTSVPFGDEQDAANSVVVQPNGQVLVGGNGQPVSGTTDFTPVWELAHIGTITTLPPTPITVSVANVPPTVAITDNNTGYFEGSTITLGSIATDPSPVDTAAGFTYAWSVTQNGNPYTNSTELNESTFAFTPDDNGTYVVTLTAEDKDGGISTPATETINVANVPPTAFFTNAVPTSGLEGTAITMTGSATDPSTVDTAAGFTYAWSVTQNGNPYTTSTGLNDSALSFTPDDNGTYVVTMTAEDKDGGISTPVTDTIAVANVPPTAFFTGTVPTAGLEGSAIAMNGGATDPSTVDTAAGFTYAWSVTKNGNPYANSSALNESAFSFTPNDNGTYVVTMTAEDKDGGISTPVTDTIAVANVPPTAFFTGTVLTTGLEGSAIAMTGGATDPSTVDTAAGFTYAWSVTKNGSAYTTSTGLNDSAFSFTPNDNGTYVVTLTAEDKDGGISTPVTDTIAVANVAPTVTPLTGTTLAVRYQTVNLSSTMADPGTLDTHTVTWNFGDGSAPVTTSMAAGVVGTITAPSHMYTAAGTYAVTLTVTDKDGGVGTTTANVTVDAVAMEADTDSAEAGKTALFVGGTNGSLNNITVVPGKGNSGLTVTINNNTYTGYSPTGRIVVYGGGASNGLDVIQVATSITLPTELYGGNGYNDIKGGSGPNIEVGGPNSDILVAGSNRDILIGAGGGDILVGGTGNDLLVAMSTEYDANPTALEALQREWTRTGISFAQQVSDITNGGGLNGNVVLTSLTTTNDGQTDILYGGGGSDEFVISNGDIVLDATGQDKVVDLSWITT